MSDLLKDLIQKIENGNQMLSFSALKAFSDSPSDFIRYKLGDKPQTDAMLLGSVLHCLVLEPEKFDKRYMMVNDTEICAQIGGLKPRGTKLYKEWMQEKQSELNGRVMVEPQDYKQAFDMRNALYENHITAKHLGKIVLKEMEINLRHMDMDFRGFIDGANVQQDNCLIFDLKLMPTAHPKKVARVIFDDMYYMQLAIYRLALKQIYDIDIELSKCYIIAVDRTCHVSVNKVHEDLLKFGEQKLEYLIRKFNECTFKNKWHEGYEFYSEYGGIFITDRPAHSYK